VWVHIKDIEAKGFLGRDLKESEEVRLKDAKKGLATLCIGGGMGVALCVERP